MSVNPIQEAPRKPPCLHRQALRRVMRNCKTCGKPTRSHELEEKVPCHVTCPKCGAHITVTLPAVQCHGCYEKEKVPEEL